MRQAKKVVLFGLWFLGFMLIMRKVVAPMSGQDPVVVEVTPAPVLGAATVATPSTNPTGNAPHLTFNTISSAALPSSKPVPNASPRDTVTPSPARAIAIPDATSSPTPSPMTSSKPSPSPSATPTASPSPIHKPFPTIPPVHLN
jgi:hypothetical protein